MALIRTVSSQPAPQRQKQHLGVGVGDQLCADRQPQKPQLLLLLHGGGTGALPITLGVVDFHQVHTWFAPVPPVPFSPEA